MSVTIITFAGSDAAHAQTIGSRAAHAQASQTSAATQSRSPAAAAATSPTFAARPSPAVTKPSAYVSAPGQTVPSRDGGDFTRVPAFDVVLGPAVEIAHTISFRLTLTIPFAYGIPVPLVIHVAADALRPIVLRRAVCGGTPEGADSRHCLQ